MCGTNQMLLKVLRFPVKIPNPPGAETGGREWLQDEQVREPLGEPRPLSRRETKHPRVAAEAESRAADLSVSGLNCLRWGQHSKNPADTSLPKCPSFPGVELQLHRKKVAEALCEGTGDGNVRKLEPPTCIQSCGHSLGTYPVRASGGGKQVKTWEQAHD